MSIAPKTIRRIIVAGMLTAGMTQAAGETVDKSRGIIMIDKPERWPMMGPAVSGPDSRFIHELVATKPEFIKLFMGQ